MLECLNSWKGTVEIDGTQYSSISAVPSDLKLTDTTVIVLHTQAKSSESQAPQSNDQEYRITIKSYMMRKATPEFDFMAKWNDDIPMPLKTMTGTIVQETRGMYRMELHADTNFEQLQTCMKCGRPITNPVSKFFGMGPECGGHNYTNPFSSNEELQQAVDVYKEEVLGKLTWSGWVIKSAITEMEEV